MTRHRCLGPRLVRGRHPRDSPFQQHRGERPRPSSQHCSVVSASMQGRRPYCPPPAALSVETWQTHFSVDGHERSPLSSHSDGCRSCSWYDSHVLVLLPLTAENCLLPTTPGGDPSMSTKNEGADGSQASRGAGSCGRWPPCARLQSAFSDLL